MAFFAGSTPRLLGGTQGGVIVIDSQLVLEEWLVSEEEPTSRLL
jgi:hypothetical protein